MMCTQTPPPPHTQQSVEVVPLCRLAELANDVMQSSFVEFWSKYEYKHGKHPKHKKARVKNKLMKVQEPTVVVPKPAVSLPWSKPGHRSRAWYCECMLKRHKVFMSEEDFGNCMHRYGGDFEAALEDFANSDDAPPVVRDAFATHNLLNATMGDPPVDSDNG